MAQGFINDASYSLEEAKQAVNRGIYHRAVRRAQECVELSLKATLRLLGVEYPRQHEVGGLLPKVSVERELPEWFLSRSVEIYLIGGWQKGRRPTLCKMRILKGIENALF